CDFPVGHTTGNASAFRPLHTWLNLFPRLFVFGCLNMPYCISTKDNPFYTMPDCYATQGQRKIWKI
ncbi:hypothetical protein PP707_06940, partial [Acetobacter pasteurianus]|nr:hypothetical protein [Acetobacter pasteurianus]